MVSQHAVATPTSPRPRFSAALEVLAWFVALGALVGGTLMVIAPDGHLLGWTTALLSATPFTDFLVPGVLLIAVIGGANIFAAVTLRRRSPRSHHTAGAAGVVLVVWLLTQMAFIGIVGLQLIMLAIAVVQITLAALALATREPESLPGRLARATEFIAHGKVAIVGLSREPRAFSRAIADAFITRGISVVGVNPAAADPPQSYARLRDVPDIADRSVFIIVPPDRSLEVVEDAIAARARTLWFHQGAGASSASPAALQRAHEAGLEVIDGLCPFMVLEPDHWLHGLHRGFRIRSLGHPHSSR